MNAPRPTDLELQVANRKRELISEIIEHKKNSSRYGAAEAIDRLQGHLTELTHLMRDVSKWSSVTPQAKQRLTEWVTR